MTSSSEEKRSIVNHRLSMVNGIPPAHWSVYIIQSSDDKLYTGITTNIERRWQAHLGSKGGARFFRGRKPKYLRFVETGHNRSSASRREMEIKKMKRREKLLLIAQANSAGQHPPASPPFVNSPGQPLE